MIEAYELYAAGVTITYADWLALPAIVGDDLADIRIAVAESMNRA